MRSARAIIVFLALAVFGGSSALGAEPSRHHRAVAHRACYAGSHRKCPSHRRHRRARRHTHHPAGSPGGPSTTPANPAPPPASLNPLTPLPPAAPVAQLDNPIGGNGCGVPDTGEDQLWTRTGRGWTGADGTYSVGLPDGRSAWIFGDTFLGTINADGSRTRSTPFVHNSLVVQNGSSLSGDYSNSAPATLIRPANGDGFFWPGAGFVQDGALHVFMLRFQSTGSGAWAFAYAGSALATFSLPSMKLASVVPVGSASSAVEWGSWVLSDGGYTYIYGVEDPGGVKYAHVARVPAGATTGPWQYWDGSAWSSDPGSSARVLAGVSNQFSVVKVGATYELISEDDYFSHDISAYAGTSPAGPFASKTVVYTTPDWGDGTFTYNAVAHPEQAGSGGLLVSYNVNYVNSSGSNYSNAEMYRPRFVRVPLSCLPATS